MKRSAPETALRAEHTRNCAVLPDRNALLDALPKRGVAMEAGVAFGAYTDAILAVNAPRELHLVDLWDTERYRLGLDAITERHGALIASGGLRIHRGRSVDVLAALPDAMFDWIYIDTDHSFETTIAELRTAARTIKPGGFLAGHDFCTGNVIAPWPYGVVEACNLFCVEAGWQFRFLAMDPRGHMSFALSRL
jgi:predicted O-methyltransferase YrrM